MLDSGAHITIVPEGLVEERRKTGEYVVLRGFQATTSSTVPTAKVKFEVEGMAEWEEIVALTPTEEGKETEVILGLRLTSPRGLSLVALANRLGEAEVGVRGMSAKESDSGQKEKVRVGVEAVKAVRKAMEAAEPKRRVKSVETKTVKAPVRRPVADVAKAPVRRPVAEVVKAPVRRPVLRGFEAAEAVTKTVKAARNKRLEGAVGAKPSSLGKVVSKESTGAGGLVADRPTSNPKPVTQIAGTSVSDLLVEESDSYGKDEWPDWSGRADSSVEKAKLVSKDQGEFIWKIARVTMEVPKAKEEVEQRVSLKPVKALEVVLRASALEQARLGKIAKARQETSRRKRKMKWGKVELDGLGERAEEERVKNLCIMKKDLVVELREENENMREKIYDSGSTVLSSMSSKPAPSAVCWTVEGLETFTGRKVSCRDICLPTLPTQDGDFIFGDPTQEAGGRENELEERSGEEVTGLRPAPSLFVGGDVGTESPQKKKEWPQEVWPSRSNWKKGVATCGVALQN